MNRRHTLHPLRRIGPCRLTAVFGIFSLASASAQTAPTGWTQVGPSVYHLTSGAATVPVSFWGTYVQNGGSVTASQGTVRLGDIVVGTSVATIYTIGSGSFTAGQLMMGFSGTGNGYFTQDGGTVTLTTKLDIGLQNGRYTLNGGTLNTARVQFGGSKATIGGVTYNLYGSFLLNGGTLVTSQIGLPPTSNQFGKVVFNGGTLQADAGVGSSPLGWITTDNPGGSGQIYSYVSQFGGKLDTNGTDRIINTPLLHDPDYAGTDGGITKLGAGTLTLTGENTYNGVTTISAGTLQTASLLGNVTNNATLNFNRGDNFTYGGVISGSGNFVKSGPATLTLSGASTFTGGTSVNSGALKLTTGGGIGAIRGALTINPGTTVETAAVDAFGFATGAKVNSIAINGGTLNNTAAGNCGWGVAYTLSNGAVLTSNGSVSSTSSASAFAFGGPSGGNTSVNVTGGVNTIAGHVNLRGDNGNSNVNFTVASGATLNVTAGISSFGGTAGLTKLGAGTMTLTGANTYTGATILSAGTLQIGDGVTSGSLASNITNNAALVFNQASGTSTYPGVISGTGTLTKTGPGNLRLTGTSTFTGGTTVNGGVITLNGAVSTTGLIGTGGSGPSSLNQIIINSGNINLESDNALAGTSPALYTTLRINQGGLLSTENNTTKLPGTTLDGGAINTASAGNSTAGNYIFTNGLLTAGTGKTSRVMGGYIALPTAVTAGTGDTLRIESTILGANPLIKYGTGSLVLTAANTYTGPTDVDAGSLIVNGSLGSTVVSISAGATLGGSGTIGGLTTLETGALLSPGNSPGTLTFTNGLSLNSGSAISLELGTASDLIRVSGGTLLGATSGPITLNLSASTGFGVGTYPIINFNGATPVNFDTTDFVFGITVPGYDYSLAQSGNVLQVQVVAVPEPSAAVLLLGSFALALGFYRRRSPAMEHRRG